MLPEAAALPKGVSIDELFDVPGNPIFGAGLRRAILGCFSCSKRPAYFLFQGQRGGWNIKKPWGWNIPTFLEVFCFPMVCAYYSASIMTIQKNHGETIATPPKRGVPTGPDSGPLEHARYPAPGGRYRRYLSLREGSEKTPRSGAY